MIEHFWEGAGVVRLHLGVVSRNKLAQSDRQIQASPGFSRIRYVIDDFRGCWSLKDVDAEGFLALAASAAAAVRLPSFFRYAAVVPPAVMPGRLTAEFAASGLVAYPVGRFERLADARGWVQNQNAVAMDRRPQPSGYPGLLEMVPDGVDACI